MKSLSSDIIQDPILEKFLRNQSSSSDKNGSRKPSYNIPDVYRIKNAMLEGDYRTRYSQEYKEIKKHATNGEIIPLLFLGAWHLNQNDEVRANLYFDTAVKCGFSDKEGIVEYVIGILLNDPQEKQKYFKRAIAKNPQVRLEGIVRELTTSIDNFPSSQYSSEGAGYYPVGRGLLTAMLECAAINQTIPGLTENAMRGKVDEMSRDSYQRSIFPEVVIQYPKEVVKKLFNSSAVDEMFKGYQNNLADKILTDLIINNKTIDDNNIAAALKHYENAYHKEYFLELPALIKEKQEHIENIAAPDALLNLQRSMNRKLRDLFAEMSALEENKYDLPQSTPKDQSADLNEEENNYLTRLIGADRTQLVSTTKDTITQLQDTAEPQHDTVTQQRILLEISSVAMVLNNLSAPLGNDLPSPPAYVSTIPSAPLPPNLGNEGIATDSKPLSISIDTNSPPPSYNAYSDVNTQKLNRVLQTIEQIDEQLSQLQTKAAEQAQISWSEFISGCLQQLIPIVGIVSLVDRLYTRFHFGTFATSDFGHTNSLQVEAGKTNMATKEAIKFFKDATKNVKLDSKDLPINIPPRKPSKL